MAYGIKVQDENGNVTFNSTTAKIQRVIATGITSTVNGSVSIPEFDNSGGNGYYFIAPIGNSYKDAIPALSWNNSTKSMNWTFYPNPTVATTVYAPLAPNITSAARYYAIMDGGNATSGQTGFGFQLSREDGNVIIDDKFQNICTTTAIGTYSGSGITPSGYPFGICYATPSSLTYSATISSNTQNYEGTGRFPIMEMNIGTTIYPRMYGEDIIEWTGSTSIRAVSVSTRKNTDDFPAGTHGLVIKQSDGINGIAFTDKDLYPEVIFSGSYTHDNFLWSGGNTGSPDYYDITIADPQGESVWGLVTITAAPMGIASGDIRHGGYFYLACPALRRLSNTTFRLDTYNYLYYSLSCSNPNVDEGTSTLGTNYGVVTAHVTLFKLAGS